MRDKKLVIYTDLDGTLLDHDTYSFDAALDALAEAQRRRIPIVLCSSKTRAEIEHLRRELGIGDPYIIENGAAVIIPAGYLPLSAGSDNGEDLMIPLGTPYLRLIEHLRELKSAFPGRIIGFSDLTAEEVASDCRLTIDEAQRAKKREFDEPFRFLDTDEKNLVRLIAAIRDRGLCCSRGGRYYHLHGHNDKGAAVRILNRRFRQAARNIYAVGIGDSLNDLPMLASVDYPVLVARPGGRHENTIIELLPRVHRTTGIGPRGWREAVTGILQNSPSKNTSRGVARR